MSRENKTFIETAIDKIANIFKYLGDKISDFLNIKEKSKNALNKLQTKVEESKKSTKPINDPKESQENLQEDLSKNFLALTPENLKFLEDNTTHYAHNIIKEKKQNIKTGINCVTSVIDFMKENNLSNKGSDQKFHTYLEYAKTDPKNSYEKYFDKFLGIKKPTPRQEVLKMFRNPRNKNKQYLVAMGTDTHGGIVTVDENGEILFSHAGINFLKLKADEGVVDFTTSEEYQKVYANKAREKGTLRERLEKSTNLRRNTHNDPITIEKIAKNKPINLTINGENIGEKLDLNAHHGGFHTVKLNNYIAANQKSTNKLYVSKMVKSA